jgi:lipopolysaccharide transport system ATP-binding protein
MPSDDIAISVKNLTKTYRIFGHPGDRIKQALTFGQKQYHKEFTALKDVSFEIKKGETVGIIGRNGSGKSTLLQLICGILKPTSGSVEVNGRISALLELGAGFNPEFTGRENVYFQGAVMGRTKTEMDSRFASIATFADIGEFLDQPVRTYSSGMFVRLAFAVNAHIDADVLVIDEALSVGDAFFVQKCMRFLQSFIKDKGTVIFVSHDIGAVTHLCKRVYWLNNGKIAKFGESREVIESYIEGIYETQQGRSNLTSSDEAKKQSPISFEVSNQDVRLNFINTTDYRNDIKITQFSSSTTGFGKGGAKITHVDIRDANGAALGLIIGGEMVSLLIRGCASITLNKPIIGFFVKNKTGQVLFGDNTYVSFYKKNKRIIAHHEFESIFTFCMPTLPLGDYVVTVAVADGSMIDHVQHHWLHDALVFKSVSTSVTAGLIGIPMKSITLTSHE